MRLETRRTYCIGMMGNIVPAVRVYGGRRLIALKEQLPGIFVSGSEEPFQSYVLLWVELRGSFSSGTGGSSEPASH